MLSEGVGAGVDRGVSEDQEAWYREGGTDWMLARAENPLESSGET